MSARYEQGCASSTGGVGDVGLCCSDLGPETWEAASGDRCNSDGGRGGQSSTGWLSNLSRSASAPPASRLHMTRMAVFRAMSAGNDL